MNKITKQEVMDFILTADNDVLVDLYDLIVDFDNNSKTSSLKEFIEDYK